MNSTRFSEMTNYIKELNDEQLRYLLFFVNDEYQKKFINSKTSVCLTEEEICFLVKQFSYDNQEA